MKNPNKEEGRSEHDQKLIDQLTLLLKSKDVLLQQQERSLTDCNIRIKQLELERNQPMSGGGQMFSNISTFGSITDLADLNIQNLDNPVVDMSDTVEQPLSTPVAQTSSAQTSSGFISSRKCGQYVAQKVVKGESMKFVAPVKKERIDTQEDMELQTVIIDDDGVVMQNVQVENEPLVQLVNIPPSTSETTVYISKSTEKKKLVLLQPPTKKSALTKRYNPGAPIHKDYQDENRSYCKNCGCYYVKKEDLTKHEKYMCGKTIPAYVCDACEKGFHTE